VEDLLGAKPDERSVMTYVSEYFHRFASQGEQEKAARRLANFASWASTMAARKNDCESRAIALLAFCKENTQKFNEYIFGEGVDAAKEAQAELRQFVVSSLARKMAEELDLESLLAEINTELKVNNRSPYQLPANCSLPVIEKAFEELGDARKRHAYKVRENRFRYVQKVERHIPMEKLAEFDESFRAFDANKNGVLTPVEFKAALMAMNITSKDEKTFEATFKRVSEGNATISKDQYFNFLADKERDTDTAEQIKESFVALAGNNKAITAQQLSQPPLTPAQIEFLLATMPQSGEGLYDFNTFVDSQY